MATLVPFADALDDAGYQRDLGPAPRTSFAEGVRRTFEEFARLRAPSVTADSGHSLQ